MDSVRRFTLVDGLSLGFAMIVLLSVFHVTAGCDGTDRSASRQLQNTTQLRGIHSGCVLFGQGCKDFYPGLMANGEEDTDPLNADSQSFGTRSTGGYDPAYRYTKLLRGNYYSPEYMMSPLEPAGGKAVPKLGDIITSAHFSYAMLRLNDPAGQRKMIAWRSTGSSTEIAVSDRNLGASAGVGASSIHGAPWIGSVVYNDGHGVFEKSNVLMTSYERGAALAADDLFADNKDGKDAAMVYQDASSCVNQK